MPPLTKSPLSLALLCLLSLLTQTAAPAARAQTGDEAAGKVAEAVERATTDEERRELLARAEGVNKRALALALKARGMRLAMRGDLAAALPLFVVAREAAVDAGDEAEVARLSNNIGRIHNETGRPEEGLKNYRRCLDIAERARDPAAVVKCSNGLGISYNQLGDRVQALAHYVRSTRLAKEIGDKQGVANASSNVAVLYHQQRDFEQAASYYREAGRMFEELGDKEGSYTIRGNAAALLVEEGKYDEALLAYLELVGLREAIGDRDGAITPLENAAVLYFRKGDYGRALEAAGRALKMSDELKVLYHKGSALEITAEAHMALGDLPRASEAAEASVAVARETGDRDQLWMSLTALGRVARALGRTADARRHFDEAVSVIDSLRGHVVGGAQQRQRFFENKLKPHHEALDLLAEQKDFARALGYAERAKARALLDVLRGGRADIEKAMTAEEKATERRLKGDIAALNVRVEREGPRRDARGRAELDAQLREARSAYSSFRTALYAAHPALRAQRGEAEPFAVSEAAGLMPGGAGALVEYVVSKDRAYLFVLTGGGRGRPVDVRLFRLNVGEEELAARVEKFRALLAQRGFDYGREARALYDLLLGPAREQLAGKTSVIVVPDGPLWDLPFQALQPAPERFLVEDAAVSYAPSLTVLREMRRRPAREASGVRAEMLAFGDPAEQGGPALASNAAPVSTNSARGALPEASRLVRALGRLYGAGRSRVYTGAEAGEGRFKAEAGRYRLLQVATHGVLDDASPMYSYLALAPEGAGEDGRLEAWEVLGMDLRADLVVLSACETARGRVGAGEGMIGMSWALFVAGVPTTVASQWKVDSAGTTELMLDFHRRLSARAPKAEALRRASLAMLRTKEYRHPFYWAGFVLVGAPD